MKGSQRSIFETRQSLWSTTRLGVAATATTWLVAVTALVKINSRFSKHLKRVPRARYLIDNPMYHMQHSSSVAFANRVL
jgi:hypothetical protein